MFVNIISIGNVKVRSYKDVSLKKERLEVLLILMFYI